MCTTRLLTIINKLVFGEKTVIPWKIAMSLFGCSHIAGKNGYQFFTATITTVVFSFMPKLVKTFGTSEIDTGFQVGLISGSLFLGRLLCSLLWGYMADVYGKKRLLIISGICLTVTTVWFGFSFNVETAIITRLLIGMSMGLAVISFALIADICDDTNSSIGTTLLLAAYSTGLIAGPAIGGILAFPGELYPAVFSEDSIFSRHGVLLPNLLIAIGLAFSLFLFFIYAPIDKRAENPTAQKKKQISTLHDEQTFLIEAETKNNNCIETTFDIKITKLNENNVSKSKKSGFKESGLYRLLSNKSYMLLCVQVFFTSAFFIGIEECIPLYAATSKEYNGYGFNTSNIGVLLMIISGLCLILEVSTIPKIVQKFGLKKSFMYGSLVACVTTPLVPLCQLIKPKYLFWTIVVVVILTLRFAMSVTFLCTIVMGNNAVEPDLLGTANGLGLTASTIARMIAVPVFGMIYSWSLKNIKTVEANKNALGFPFDQYFIFFVLSLMTLFIALYTLILPDSLNKKIVVDPVT